LDKSNRIFSFGHNNYGVTGLSKTFGLEHPHIQKNPAAKK
jgi:hypothetical protein